MVFNDDGTTAGGLEKWDNNDGEFISAKPAALKRQHIGIRADICLPEWR